MPFDTKGGELLPAAQISRVFSRPSFGGSFFGRPYFELCRVPFYPFKFGAVKDKNELMNIISGFNCFVDIYKR
jgi:hypothetical protein